MSKTSRASRPAPAAATRGTIRLSDDQLREIADRVLSGKPNFRAIAAETGVSRSSIMRQLVYAALAGRVTSRVLRVRTVASAAGAGDRARIEALLSRISVDEHQPGNPAAAHAARTVDPDPAIYDAMNSVGTGLQPAAVWLKTGRDADGIARSILLRPAAIDPELLADRLVERMSDIRPVAPAPAPRLADDADQLLTVYTLADVHVGQLSRPAETGGEAYDLDIALDRVRGFMRDLSSSAPSSARGLIVVAGDLLHTDDTTNTTPRHGHHLDAAGRYYEIIDVAIEALVSAVDLALGKHGHVTVAIVPGNHDPHSCVAVRAALRQRYRLEPRVEVDPSPRALHVTEHGKVMVCATHGHESNGDRLVMSIADVHAEAWGRTRHRVCFTGHFHHRKRSGDHGGMEIEQLRPVTARDAHAAAGGYTSRSEAQAITYHAERGEIMRARVCA